jgi:hypothetical protein
MKRSRWDLLKPPLVAQKVCLKGYLKRYLEHRESEPVMCRFVAVLKWVKVV